MKPKLLVTASTFPRWPQDTEPRFVLDLALALREEFDITVLVPAAPGAREREEMDGLHIRRYHYFPLHRWETLCYPGAIVPRIRQKPVRALLVPFLLLALWWNLLRMHRQFDVVHAHWIIPQGIVQSCFRTPYLVTGHGGDVTSLNAGPLRLLKRRCLRRAAAITVVSAQLQTAVQALCPQRQAAVLPMGCDCTAFSPARRVEGLFGQGEKKVILFVGRLAEKKGLTYLLTAMETVDAMLVIAGDGPLRGALQAQAAPLGGRVRFLGARDHAELARLYASADVFAAPSVQAKDGDMEGMPTVILEAMASGLPVVASRSGGIPDVVRDGQNGLLVPPADAAALAAALRRLLADPALCARLAAGGAHTVEAYDYRRVGAGYAALLNGIRKGNER